MMEELSPDQQAAVAHVGTPTLVVAGAGSGKTRTLTAKIAHLASIGYAPERILAITFTNKAADEMKQRLVRLTGMPVERFPWVRTYHSACLRILKNHCDLLGFTRPLQVFASYQQQKLIKDILAEMKLDKKHAGAVIGRISNAKNSGDPARYFDSYPWSSRIPIADIYSNYERRLRSSNAVDFDNILLLTRDLLRQHPDVRERWQSRYDYILCDEYQDTNDLNEQITGLLLKNGNLFVVGDDWQSIYSFRMSNVDHFLSFEKKYPGARVFRLERNYRSADEIVQVANALIDKNQYKMDKRCYSDIRGGRIEIHPFFDDRQEADWVAQKIASIRDMGSPLDRVAILYRTRFCSLAFEQALRRHGVAYRMLGGKGFYERREIQDLNAYLNAAVFDKDDVSFERVVNTPKRGVGPGAIARLQSMREEGMSLKEAVRKALSEKLLAKKLYESLLSVMTALDEVREMAPDEALREVIARVAYHDYMEGYAIGSADLLSRRENIEQLLYSAGRHKTIVDYLEEASLVQEDRADEEEGPAGVNLSTMHAAKGLEFHTVFVVACEESLFPHWKSAESEAGMEEERRLMYVSMTRGERHVHLSHASLRKGNFNERSRFIDEVAEILK